MRNYDEWLSDKVEALTGIAGRFPLNSYGKLEYANKLRRWSDNRNLLDEVFSYFAGEGVFPTPNQFYEEMVKHEKRAEDRKKIINRDDRLLYAKKVTPQEVLAGYVEVKKYLPSVPRTADIDNACLEIYGRILSDEELLVMLPECKVESRSYSAN